MCDLEAIGNPTIFKLIRSVGTLTKMLPTLDLTCEENVGRWKWVVFNLYLFFHCMFISSRTKIGEGQGKEGVTLNL